MFSSPLFNLSSFEKLIQNLFNQPDIQVLREINADSVFFKIKFCKEVKDIDRAIDEAWERNGKEFLK